MMLLRWQFLRLAAGAAVIVTATGCEELNHIPTSVTHKQ
jgi:hypothetical protein